MLDPTARGGQGGDDANDPLDAALRLAFRPAPPAMPAQLSVLGALEERAGAMPRVHLRWTAAEPALPISISPVAGAREASLGRYQVFGEIARGGVGKVLRGRDPELGRDLAIKVLLEAHESRPEMVRRFIEEAQIAGQLQHPGVVPIYDLGLLAGDRPFFTMKLIQGRTLAALLETRGDPAADRRRFLGIFEQVCQTMAYAHARGVVHRDLKPSNVMVGAFGEVQVMDWGLAKVLSPGGNADEARTTTPLSGEVRTIRNPGAGSDRGSASHAGQVLGTPAYMAPEQARGDVATIDERTDVFGLGAILCEVLTGAPPHGGTSAVEVCRNAAAGRLEAALEQLDACRADPELILIAKRCLQPGPRDRPRDAGVVAREVTAYLTSVEDRARAAELAAAESRAKAEEAVKTAFQERRAQRLTRSWAATVVVLVLLGAGGYVVMERERRHRTDAARSAVTAAMEEAASLRGQAEALTEPDPGRWTRALAAARRAETIARTGGIDAPSAARAVQLASDLEALEKEARETAARAARDRGMEARLEAIRAGLGDHWEWAREDSEYAQAFREYGIDVDALDAEVAAVRVRACPTSATLCVALDEWVRARRKITSGADPRRDKLGAILAAADPDPWRARLRAAADKADTAALLELASAPDTERAPPESVDLLASSLAVAGQLAPALELWRQAARRHPGDFWLHHNLASWVADAQPPRHEERLLHAQAALAIRPESAHAWTDLADAFQAAGDLAATVAARRDVVARQPGAEKAHFALGNALSKAGDAPGAIAAFREAVRLQPEYVEARINLGLQLEVRGDLAAAAAELREAVRVRPTFAAAHFNLGAALLGAGDLAGAVASLRETLRLEPEYPRGSYTLGIVLWRQEDFEGAERAFREAARAGGGDADASYNLGTILAGRGDRDGALAAFDEAIRIQPDHAEAHGNRGVLLAARGDRAGAAAAYREALRLDPNAANTHYNLGNVLAELDDVDGAIQAFSEAVRLRPIGSAYSHLGAMLGRKGDLRGALAAHREAVRIAPGSAVAHYNLAAALEWQRDDEAALVSYREAVRLAPERPAMRAELALACRRRRLNVEATRLWKELATAGDGTAAWEAEDWLEAARAAAGAACREGVEPTPSTPEERSGWRQDAIAWLEGGIATLQPPVAAALLSDSDLACLREARPLEVLPASERARCEALWSEVRKVAARR